MNYSSLKEGSRSPFTFIIDDINIDSSNFSGELIDGQKREKDDRLMAFQEFIPVKTHFTDSLSNNTTMGQEYQTKIQSLQSQISELEAKNYELSDKSQSIVNVNTTNVEKLIKKIKELELSISDKNYVIEKQKNIIGIYEDKIDMLEREVNVKSEEVSRLNKENDELKSKLLNNSHIGTIFEENANLLNKLREENDSLNKQVIRLNRQVIPQYNRSADTQEVISGMNEQLKDLTDMYERALKQLNEYKIDFDKEKNAYNELLKKHECIKDENKSLKDTIAENAKHLERAQRIIKNYKDNYDAMLESFPSVTSLTELVHVVKRIPDKEKEERRRSSETMREVDRLGQKAMEFDILKQENLKQKNQINLLIAESRICRSFVDIHNKFYDELLYMTSAPLMCLKHIILMIMMLGRWQSLPKTAEKLYTKKSHNWWWVTSGKNLSPLDTIKERMRCYDLLERENRELKETLEEAKGDLSVIGKQEENNNNNMHLINQFLQNQIQQLNEELSDAVNREEYEKRTKLYYETKQALRIAQTEISELKKERNILNDKLLSLDARVNSKEEQYQDMKQKFEDAALTVNELQEQIVLIRRSQSIKQKELIMLERGIIKNEEEKKHNGLQIKAIVTENEHLYKQIKHWKDKNNTTPHDNIGNPSRQKCLRTLL